MERRRGREGEGEGVTRREVLPTRMVPQSDGGAVASTNEWEKILYAGTFRRNLVSDQVICVGSNRFPFSDTSVMFDFAVYLPSFFFFPHYFSNYVFHFG